MIEVIIIILLVIYTIFALLLIKGIYRMVKKKQNRNKFSAYQLDRLRQARGTRLYDKLFKHFTALNNCPYRARVVDLSGKVLDEGVSKRRKAKKENEG